VLELGTVSPDGALVDRVHLAARRTVIGFGEVVRIRQRTNYSVNARATTE